MEEVGQVRTIVRDLFSPKALASNGTERHRVLLVPPGGKAGVHSAGALHALAESGIPAQHFDTTIGLSAGAYNTTAYAAGKAQHLREVYEHLCGIPFWFPQWWRGDWRHLFDGDWMNLQYLHDLLSGLGLDEISRDTWPDVRIGLSDLSGKLALLRARDVASVLALCRASSSILPLSSGVCIEDKHYIDGGHAHPCPLREAVRDAYRRGNEVDVLVVANRPHPRHLTYVEQVAFQYFAMLLQWYSWSLYRSTRQFDDKMHRAAHSAQKERRRIRVGMLFPKPKDAIAPFEWRTDIVRHAGNQSYWQMAQIAAQCRPRPQI